MSDESVCDDCSGPNIVWFTDSPWWNAVVRAHERECVLCISCFVKRAEQLFDVTGWYLTGTGRVVPVDPGLYGVRAEQEPTP